MSYCFWLDFQIRKEFEGKRWSVPARVYAQPVELYIGRHFTQARLQLDLRKLGYQPVSKLSGPGQFLGNGVNVELFTREFHYWDGIELSKKIRIQFDNQRISEIRDLTNGKLIQIFRLEPTLIGKIFPLHDEDRVLVNADEIPQALIDALIAVEDRNYFEHHGIDPKGILRSMFANILAGKIAQGGSTLTQQLVKNMFLSRERTFTRKLNEMLMALMLEYHYSKEDILVAYINEIYLGQNGAQSIHGFGTAAEFYFSRPLTELSLDKIALLVGMVKGASYFNPRNHPERALKRRNLVLDLMQEQGFINASENKAAHSRILRVRDKPDWSSAKYPAFLDLVRRHLKRDYQIDDLRNEGLQIHTSLDADMQDSVQKNVKTSMAKLDRAKGFKTGTLQTAVVIVNQHDGEVLALLGDRDKEKNSFNRALDANRPIGSLIKPAIYLTALDNPSRYHVLSILDDSPISLKQGNGKQWTPKNYDNRSHGKVPLVRSISHSYNLSTVRLGMKLGLDKVIKTLKNLGINRSVPRLPSLLLGAIDLSPYEVTQMYQTLASGGLQIPLKTVRAVLDSEGRPLKRYDLAIREYVKPESAFLTQFLLTEVVQHGTAKRLTRELPSFMPLAGKTGTTNGLRDSWFAGFGDRMTAVVWVGRDDNQPTKLTGSSGAMQVWLDIMKQLKPLPLTLFAPEDIKWRSFPDMSDPEFSCKDTKSYPFVKNHIPANVDCF